MLLQFFEAISQYTINASIRDESLGDLWEGNEKLKSRGTPPVWRALINIWRFLSLVNASIFMILEGLGGESLPSGNASNCSKNLSDPVDYDLDSRTLQTIRRYCNARFSSTSEQTVEMRSLLEVDSSKIKYWLQQVDRSVEQFSFDTGNPDCETIVNSLILMGLIRKLESIPPDQIDGDYFHRSIKAVALSDYFINKYVEFSDETFMRKLIISTWCLTVYVISWESGQESWMHHHGNALDLIKVIQGEMTHWIVPPEDWDRVIPYEGCKTAGKYEGPSQILIEGDTVLIARRHGHQIANLSKQKLITLHYRFGPPPEDEHWRSTTNPNRLILIPSDYSSVQPLVVHSAYLQKTKSSAF
jgi:mannose-6-phosphate isomerase-like protein (cupin superfamily)